MNVILTRVLGLSQSIDIDYRPDRKSRWGFTGTPVAAVGSKNKQQVPSLACSLGGGKLVPSHLARGQECVQGLGSRGGLGRSTHPSGDADCRGTCAVPSLYCQHSVFAPGSSKAAVGLFWSFCIFRFRICPNCSIQCYFQSHIISLYFVTRGDVCLAESRAAKCPRLQPASDAPVL